MLKRFFTVNLTKDQVTAFLAIAKEHRVLAISGTKNGLLYIVEGEAMCEGFRQKLRDLVGFAGFREYPSPPRGEATSHAREVEYFFLSTKSRKKAGK